MLAEVRLDDKYTATSGRILLSGTQALVRLPLEQSRLDARMGINSAGYISGYRGSPVGTYDSELWRAQRLLTEHGIVFQPGVNEDLAATAIWGTQQLGLFPGARHDGVFALWYGKGPGVDRSGDAFKHANLAGTSPRGGVLVAFGDDHGAKSSTLAHQSEQAMVAASIPVLNPATIADLLEFGLFGWAMSRYSGLWVGLKCVNELLEASATVELSPLPPPYREPEGILLPPGGIHIRMGHEPVETERRLMRNKLPMALAFAGANSIDRIVWNGAKKRLGIVAAGKAWLDVLQALSRLGIDQTRGEALGIGLYKPGLTWPIEPVKMRAFVQGYEEILFVEEKRPLIEDQAARLLYAMDPAVRPALSGKTTPDGVALLPSDGMLDPGEVAHAIAARLKALGMVDARLGEAIAANEAQGAGRRANAPAGITRRPYFCSGCPHNSSTKVPQGSHAMAGIGCSYMAVWMDRDTVTSVHMGAEGANWNGIAPFTDMPHIFQNIGDGTYFHSGLMAIRAAVASGANITYKILFNDAVAMTGGQPVDGPLSVPQISRQVAAEGVAKIVVVTDEPGKYPADAGFAPGVIVHHRDDLELDQLGLRAEKGTTVLIYDQTCAAEKRRRRKRHEYPDPPKRAFINDAVCEGCGDCTVKSNCVSVLPLETELGRKRQIDQSACNKDFSCINGFCPSFVTVHGGELRKAGPGGTDPALWAGLPEPELALLDQPWSMVITGIGGTGVVTIGAILGMAAHMEGKAASVFDMTGLAQKNGAVMSHLRIASDPGQMAAVRIGSGEADVILGCDLVVSGSDDALKTIHAGRTRAIVNSHVVPTGDFQQDTDVDFHADAFQRAIRTAAGTDATDFFDATSLATRLAGDSIAANLIMVGYASQKGLLPVSPAAIERAIELNGVAVEANKRNLALGRMAAARPDALQATDQPTAEPERPFAEFVARRTAMLEDYQDRAYADAYRGFVGDIAALEESRKLTNRAFARAVAASLHKLMAYKDEYEVARLYTSGAFLEKVRTTFAGDYRLGFHMAPPLLARRDPVSGELKKREFGPWVFTAFRALARMKRLRGTVFDIFGYTSERRHERRMIGEYRDSMLKMARELTPANHDIAVEIARLPMKIRGYGHVKERKFREVEAERQALLKQFAGATK